MRLATIWASATLFACASTPPQAPVRAPPIDRPITVAELPAPAAPGPIDLLAARGVYHDDFVRPILYTWTTPRQIAGLRDDRRLLVAEASAGEGPSLFLRELAALAKRRGPGHDVATALLKHPALVRRRYAWPSPFATTMGLGPIRYGDALIRVELDPRAIVLRFRPADDAPLGAFDMQGAPVPIAQVDPTKIAAVYHVRDGPNEQTAYREYVLCNESMIAAWSIATPIDDWHASLAFDNARYRPSRRNLAAIVTALQNYDGSGEPLRHGAQSSHAAR